MDFKKTVLAVTASLGCSILPQFVFGMGQIDIRANQILTESLQDVRYRISVERCPEIADVSINGKSLSLSEAIRTVEMGNRCEFDVLLSGQGRFAPSVTVTDINGQSVSHHESFSVESNLPSLEFNSVSITGTSQDQWLELHLNANDDVDITSVSVDVLGLRASVLAEVGGVVDDAANSAFASTNGYQVIVPHQESQTEFVLRVPVDESLSASEIQHDGVVLIDAQAKDASGNVASFNRIAFTGEDVQEGIQGVRVEPDTLVLTNALEQRQLSTIVDFEFRGEVRLNTQTSGLSYSSSDTSKVLVTDEGVVFPLQETSEPVAVIVNYGTDIINVPVTVDYSKVLTSLSPVSPSLHLPSLNRYYDFTDWQVTFDDGSTITLGKDHEINFTVPDWAKNLINIKNGQVMATQVITADAPIEITAELVSQGLVGKMILTAEDAVPEVSVDVPNTVNVGETLSIDVDIQDDVGASDVVFFIDDKAVGRVTQPPYKLDVPAVESLAGQQLEIYARVTDTAAHVVTSPVRKVWVQYEPVLSPPDYKWTLPAANQVVVGGVTMAAVVEKNLGSVMSAAISDIDHVEYFLDGDRKAVLRFPAYEVRKIDGEDILFELWRVDLDIAETSLAETSLAINAKVYGSNGAEANAGGRLVRVVKNTEPKVSITAPGTGSSAVVGETLNIQATVVDDALQNGVTARLIVNDDIVASRQVKVDRSEVETGARNILSKTVNFNFDITEEYLGQIIRVSLRATDFHGKTANTDDVRVTVLGDQDPTVALTAPIEGAALISGLATELRANASDDIGVTEVAFYVNENLVGVDTVSPYALVYDTPANLKQAQTVSLKAIATDTAGNKAESQPVTVSVGPDFDPPVINWASPEITGTHADGERADVIEKRDFVLKITGYDNVKATRIEATGIALVNGRYTLTGNAEDILSGDDLPLQYIPDTLHAYSSLIRVAAPAFSMPEGQTIEGWSDKTDANVPYNSYPVTLTAYDEVGNTSAVKIYVAVLSNQAPVISDIKADKATYYVKDTVNLAVVATDDIAVSDVKAYWSDADGNALAQQQLTTLEDFVPSPLITNRFQLNLSELNLANTGAELSVQVVAVDNFAVESVVAEKKVTIVADAQAPKVGVLSPLAGSELISGKPHNINVRMTDETGLKSLTVYDINGHAIASKALSGEKVETVSLPSIVAPVQGKQWLLSIRVTDIWGQEKEVQLSGPVVVDQPPAVSIRTPATGSRYYEGESFNVNALVNDDLGIRNVALVISDASGELMRTRATSQDIQKNIDNGDYIQFSLVTPTKTAGLSIVVEAVDSSGQSVTAPVDIEIIDDLEAPELTMTTPSAAFSLLPGKTFKFKGQASDNQRVDKIHALIIDQDGIEYNLPYQAFLKNDRIESIEVPNKGTLGGIVVSSRFFSDFEGSVLLPQSFIYTHAGQAVELVFEATDLGINHTRSEPLQLTILGDKEPPRISFDNIKQYEIEQTPFAIGLVISDNFSVESYSVRIEYQGNSIDLGGESDLSETSLNVFRRIAPPTLDFIGDIDEEKRFVIVVDATDTFGNSSQEVVQVTVKPDQPPRIKVVNQTPATPLNGSILKTHIHQADDYSSGLSSRGVSFASSLIDLTGWVVEVVDDNSNNSALVVRIPQTEGDFSIRADEDKSVLMAADDGQVSLFDRYPVGRKRPITNLDKLYLSNPDGSVKAVSYDITREFYGDCGLQTERFSVQAVDGVIDLLGDEPDSVTSVQLVFTSGMPGWLRGLRYDFKNLFRLANYSYENNSYGRRNYSQLLWDIVVDDEPHYVTHPFSVEQSGNTIDYSLNWFVPKTQAQYFNIYTAAFDRFTKDQPIALGSPSASYLLADDNALPELTVTSPESGVPVVAGQRMTVSAEISDNSAVINRLSIKSGTQTTLVNGALFEPGSRSYTVDVPLDWSAPEYSMELAIRDEAGALATQNWAFPVEENLAPQIEAKAFRSYKVGGNWQKNYTDAARLNYAEFWVRYGESFLYEIRVSDDESLKRARLYKKSIDGHYIGDPIIDKQWTRDCGKSITLNSPVKEEVTFDEPDVTEYEWVVEDYYGHLTKRSFLVHPLTNMAPQIELISPADDQLIVAGTHYVRGMVAVTDDRLLDKGDIELRIDGRLAVLKDLKRVELVDLDSETVTEASLAFDHLYDNIERVYGPDMADEWGHRDSLYARIYSFIAIFDGGLTNDKQVLVLESSIEDSDNLRTLDTININLMPDKIQPAVYLLEPEADYGPVEGSDFTLKFQAYDNTNVKNIKLSYAVAAQKNDEVAYTLSDYTLLQSKGSIDAEDFDPLTTSQVETPVYRQIINTPSFADIASELSINEVDIELAAIYIKLEAEDAWGNVVEAESFFNVRRDEPPVIDIVEPLINTDVVEQTPMYVSITGFDDVGITEVELKAEYGNGDTAYTRTLRQPPWQFEVPVPAFDDDNPNHNTVTLTATALDTYGDRTGDSLHRVTEPARTITIVKDEPPVVAFGLPVDGDTVTEGEYVLIQLTAVDDVAVNSVSVQVDGLISGNKTLTDMVAPYEFLLSIPYGQAGQPVTLTASVTETRYTGEARTVQAVNTVVLDVLADTIAPEIQIEQPYIQGTTVVEKGFLPYRMIIKDNVSVSSVRTTLFADKNGNGSFETAEAIATQVQLAAPYAGSISVSTIEAYWQDAATAPEQMALQFKVEASDGVGNKSVQTRPVKLIKNAKPEVTAIQILDSSGNSMGGINEITEGRRVRVTVAANDPEVGVDSVQLFQASGDSAFASVGTDGAAPFAFDIAVPSGKAGDVLKFKAIATDVDGYQSDDSLVRSLTIVADVAPEVSIVKPANDESVIIDGQDIEIYAEVFDDLGPEGVDRVVFYVNNQPLYTAWSSYSDISGSYAQDHIYRASISAPEGVDGFYVQAVAYDVLGHQAKSETVLIGQIRDTVVPQIEPVYPLPYEILTAGESVNAYVGILDIGVIDSVKQTWQREVLNVAGEWQVKDSADIELASVAESDDSALVNSDPANHYFVYSGEMTSGLVLRRTGFGRERVRITTTVSTEEHTVSSETIHEVGLAFAESRYVAPVNSVEGWNAAKEMYFSAVDQYQSSDRKGAMLTVWNTQDPITLEELYFGETALGPQYSGLSILDAVNEEQSAEDGNFFAYSNLLSGSQEIFKGTIGEFKADANLVVAGKSAVQGLVNESRPITIQMFEGRIKDDWINGSASEGTGRLYYENQDAELLLFGQVNADGQFGLPYLLKGRLDLPYPVVLGLDRKDNLVFVANGHGGVQVIDIRNFTSPYHVGYIKPDGYARDVVIDGQFAYIAASFQGVVVADISDPAMPIVATLDTLGVANRLFLQGDTLYVSDLSGEGRVSQLNAIASQRSQLLKSLIWPTPTISVLMQPSRS
ncbi:MAG: Ig-like domain-containing protein [Reinekea sp.]